MNSIDWNLRAVQITVDGLSEFEAMLITFCRGSAFAVQQDAIGLLIASYFVELAKKRHRRRPKKLVAHLKRNRASMA